TPRYGRSTTRHCAWACRWRTRCAAARLSRGWWTPAWHEARVLLVPALPFAGLRVPGGRDRRRLRDRPRTGRVLPAGRALGWAARHGGEHAGMERGADAQLRAGAAGARLRLPRLLPRAARAWLGRVRTRLRAADAGHPGGHGRGRRRDRAQPVRPAAPGRF